jgi:hypothetical protein
MLTIEVQPDDAACGPTCLHAVYRHYGDTVPLASLTEEVAYLPTGGTLAVLLACHALERGYQATIYSYNLQVFDPTWFALDGDDLVHRLEARAAVKRDAKLKLAIEGYLRFLRLGGKVAHEDLSEGLLARLLHEHGPLLTGLSATYLYDCPREIDGRYDDIAGEPAGHFVVLHHYDENTHSVDVADPLASNPTFPRPHYVVPARRLIASILLGIVTYDANLLLIEPPR